MSMHNNTTANQTKGHAKPTGTAPKQKNTAPATQTNLAPQSRTPLQVMLQLVGLVAPLSGVMCVAIVTGVLGFVCAIAISVLGAYGVVALLPALLPNVSADAANTAAALLPNVNPDAAIATGTIFGLPLQPSILPYLFGAIALCAVLRGVLHYAEQACNHYIAFRLLAHIRDKVFAALRKLAPAKLDGADTGNLIAILTGDIELLEVFYAHTVSPICIAAILSSLMVAFLGQFHWALGFIAAVAYLFVGVCIPVAASRSLRGAGQHHRAGFGALSGYFLDSIRGIREVLQYQCGAQRQAELARRTDALEATAWQMKRSGALTACATNFAVLGFSLLAFLVAAVLHLQGVLGLAGVIIPTITIFSSFGAVIALANLGAGLSQTIASGNRVLDVLAEAPVVQDVTDGQTLPTAQRTTPTAAQSATQNQPENTPAAPAPLGAALQSVNFAYADQPILQGCTLHIAPGQITGITGKSGCGKSTALKLLMRFWDAQSGSVTIGGQDVKTINTASLRTAQSFVTQDTYLFHDSIANNLLLAKPDATQSELIAACKKASVHDFIESLPQGYNTPVGELGSTLSGGERQRLGIARAFLHDAPLLLLDEPTSNLDSLNEAVILRALHQDDTHRTIVLVSHRASTMKIAQNVYHLTATRNS